MFFHLSKFDLGDSVILTPKVPESSLISKEGNIPRICVSSDVWLCICSIISVEKPSIRDLMYEFIDRTKFDSFEDCKKHNEFFLNPVVYEIDDEPFLPPDASDFRKNKEHWFLTPKEFNKKGYLDFYSLLKGKIHISSENKKLSCEQFVKEFTNLDEKIIREKIKKNKSK